MTQISSQGFNEFLERLGIERKLLDGCNTEGGYFEWVWTHFLPFLKKDSVSSLVVSQWQKSAEDLSLVMRANNQLNTVFIELWKHAVYSGNRSLRRHLIQILRRIRGPARYIEISLSGHSPISQAADSLRPLYIEHVAHVSTEHFSFLPSVCALERQARQFTALVDNDPSLLWSEMITLENCQILKETSIFWLRWKTILGEKTTIGIRAYHQWYEYLIAGSAKELRMLEETKCKSRYFVREEFARKIDRLCMELNKALKMLVVETVQDGHYKSDVLVKNKKIHGRTLQEAADRKDLLPIGLEVWHKIVQDVSLQELKNLSQSDVADEIKRVAKARGINLRLEVPARYSNVAKDTDPRLWRGGSCLGFKPGYSVQEGGI